PVQWSVSGIEVATVGNSRKYRCLETTVFDVRKSLEELDFAGQVFICSSIHLVGLLVPGSIHNVIVGCSGLIRRGIKTGIGLAQGTQRRSDNVCLSRNR